MEYMGFESTQAVYKWEAGKCYPQADNLLALAKLYQVSPAELLVEEDNESSSTVWLQPVYLSRDRFEVSFPPDGILRYSRGNRICLPAARTDHKIPDCPTYFQ